jgi:hypothetical protein
MTTTHVSAHLLADWLPTFPATVSSSLVGWPPFLLEGVPHDGRSVLALKDELGRTERQWKSVLSWMLGIAGTRHFLLADDYRWIAPLSAFYPDVARDVDVAWPPAFRPRRLSVAVPAKSRIRLRPDYVALSSTYSRSGAGWAIVEAKGNPKRLEELSSCPMPWYRQARNIVVAVDGAPISVERHIVVSTKVAPNRAKAASRRLQIRAWNSQETREETTMPKDAALELVSAHLFGLFLNLRLFDSARALAWAVERRGRPGWVHSIAEGDALVHRAAEELARRDVGGRVSAAPARDEVLLQGSWDGVDVSLAPALIKLSRGLMSANTHAAFEALQGGDLELDEWIERPSPAFPGLLRARLPIGVTVRVQLPEGVATT